MSSFFNAWCISGHSIKGSSCLCLPVFCMQCHQLVEGLIATDPLNQRIKIITEEQPVWLLET